MLKTGQAHLAGLRDGRTVYVGGERVADVTAHPAFRRAAQSVAAIYDLKRAPAQRDTLSYEEGGELFSMYYLLPRSRDDLYAIFPPRPCSTPPMTTRRRNRRASSSTAS